jgi:hypothetical protein
MTVVDATITTTTSAARTTDRADHGRRVWPAGLLSGLVAAAATTAVAATAHAAGISLAISGERIPLFGFAQLTAIGALLGLAIGAIFARRARCPRHTFIVTTVALTVATLVPDVIVDATTGTKLVLMLTHVVAAAIVIPSIARRLAA